MVKTTLRFINKLSILIIVLTLINTLTSGCGKSPQKPNILFIAVDDLRPELGIYGQNYVQSPNIDRLAESGFTFTRAFCQSAVCNPSRASLLTGLRPDSIKVWDLRTKLRDTVPDVVTLPQYFKNNGYHSVAIGKIFHNVIPDSQSWSEPKLHIDGYPFDPDAVYRMEENVAWLEKRKQQIIAAGKEKRHIDRLGQWYLKYVATENIDVPDDAYFDGAQADVAVKKLAELKKMDKPFFFGIGFYRPHLPFNAPKKYWDLYDRNRIPLAENDFLPENAPLMAINNMRELRGYADFKQVPKPHEGKLNEQDARLLKHGYLASVSYIDAQVGKLLDALEKEGLAENTIVVLWGDHGWKLGEHNSWAKMTNYEIDTRVPLIIRAPGVQNMNTRLNQLVEFVDVYPTLCELAGLPVPEHLQGISTVPLLHNSNLPWKKAVFSQFLREGIWIAPDGVEYMGYAIRTERYRYVRWINWETKEFAAQELYDHQTDPNENVNIADDPQNVAVVQQLAAQLDAGWREALPGK
ncbi:MAG: sulfatase [Deferribacteres bacterium]|nr:sulfatase [candidate division KSB1 bacterium]MCB9503472.1 sulfatase [Deferribacteres bacterium]